MGRGGASSRGRGKFKPSRGGGRHFSRDIEDRMRGNMDNINSEDSESESESEDDEVEHKLAPEMAALNLKLGNTVAVEESEDEGLTRAERKAKLKKAAKEAKHESEDEGEDELVNPWPAAKVEPSRREREAAEKKRFQQRQAAGKTQQAKSDLARLQEIRKRREAAAAQRAAEQEEAAREAADKQARLVAKK
ncbi:hypothetical protein CspeluHIS016_0204900 [Cutaneotrichosporon spelunceum]|uniref:Casein kinase substrate phosphoprotein PP28 domain-containing protein n=1 Tax=Cutaneotrichosporon spelunceum TaxID=1672016 RepID=A0AAD3YB64_9TREE|nr:hypothetical protein CspeluHIS016_0204900 [Cutaneotrichosporon spelunceum]